LHNDDLNQVTREMRAMGGAPKFVDSQSLPDVDYADFVAVLGQRAVTVNEPDDLAVPGATHCRPIDKAAASAVLAGDESRIGFIKEGLTTKAQEFLPHKTS
jgi:pyruvate dehydrogenase (quinone)